MVKVAPTDLNSSSAYSLLFLRFMSSRFASGSFRLRQSSSVWKPLCAADALSLMRAIVERNLHRSRIPSYLHHTERT